MKTQRTIRQPIHRALLAAVLLSIPTAGRSARPASKPATCSNPTEAYRWKEASRAAHQWAPRAGLQVLHLNDRLYLMGGRTPIDPAVLPVPGASIIWGDVWESRNRGNSWKRILSTFEPGHWPGRAYFEAVTMGSYMYVLGGQNFYAFEVPNPTNGPPILVTGSDFFNDVWRSADGVHWEQTTTNAGWEARAGLSAEVFKGEIYVMGGSQNDDDAISTTNGPARIYFNDVWKSPDGIEWTEVTPNAPWAKRAGARLAVKGDYMYLIGGEAGFIGFPPPYFNDVWRTSDGMNWTNIVEQAPWSARPGHMCVVMNDQIYLFGGFGLAPSPFPPFFDPTVPGNPMDVWASPDGIHWTQVDGAPWNAASPADVKYDFDALLLPLGGGKQAIFTFGGDRETFDFSDPLNYLNIDNDVWSFAPAPPRKRGK
jgi:hypothetical protein